MIPWPFTTLLIAIQVLIFVAVVVGLLSAIKEVWVKWREHEAGEPKAASYTWRRLIALSLSLFYMVADSVALYWIIEIGAADLTAAFNALAALTIIRAIFAGSVLFIYTLGPTLEELTALVKGFSGLSIGTRLRGVAGEVVASRTRPRADWPE